GILDRIAANNGDTVQTGDLLAVVNIAPAAGDTRTTAKQPGAEKVSAAPDPDSPDADPVLTPAVRRLIKETQIDPDEITGTGKDGRIQKSDVLAYLDTQKTKVREPVSAESPAPVSNQEISAQARPEQRVPMTRLRSRIAERLLQAQQNAAILTTFNEIDLYAADTLRKRYRDAFEKQHAAKLGYMSFFVKATVGALKRFPVVNASIGGQDIICHGYYDFGIAPGSAIGLVLR
ncbi:MAG: dihydrolipoamide succinyltransferase, partial [Rhodobacteraceae bacterium]|nr:dihydrolipoamide succinyltransferase [Paracoccaceae bacterium]